MKNFKKGFVLVAVLAVAGQAQAQKKEGLIHKANREVSGQGYGDAGCGLGSIVFGDQPGFTQVFASTTNGTSGNQTFGISSGTSNCGGLSGNSAYIPLDQYIAANKVALQSDLAKGSGETIDGLANLMGCDNSQHLGQTLKTNFSKIFSNGSTNMDSAKQIQDAAKSDAVLAKSCQTLG